MNVVLVLLSSWGINTAIKCSVKGELELCFKASGVVAKCNVDEREIMSFWALVKYSECHDFVSQVI